MAEVIKSDKYILSDPNNNNNKFWYITLFDDDSTLVEFGRVGAKGSSSRKNHDLLSTAEKFYDSKCKAKEKGKKGQEGYRKLDVLDTIAPSNSKVLDLEQVVEEQIKSNTAETKALLRHFINANIHNITSNTAITYNKQSGLFETPCGPVTRTSILDAQVILTSISKWMKNKNRDERKFSKLVSEYMMLIPMNIGMRGFDIDSHFSTKEHISKQEGILESLEFTYDTIINSAQDDSGEKVERPKIFDVEFELLEDDKEIKRIKSMYYDTKNSMHSCHRMKPKRIFKVKIGKMAEQFNEGRKVGNVKELWHGTRDGNILSIMKGGLVIPSSSDGHCTGRMFGDGIYFSDQSTKALNYAAGYWSGSRVNKCYMFVADVAMGKEFHPRSSDWSMHKKIKRDGYDSCFAKAGGCVRNNEMIVYNLNQANLKYLVEFEG